MSDDGTDASAINLSDTGVVFFTFAQMGNMDVMTVGSAIFIGDERSLGVRTPILLVAAQMSQSRSGFKVFNHSAVSDQHRFDSR